MNRQALTSRLEINASLLFACLALVGCGPSERSSASPSSKAVRVASECESNVERRYFPARSAAGVPSKVLEAMHEPPLSCGVQPDSYRILWFTAFSTVPPPMVRISRISDRWVATGVRLAGWGDDRNLTEIDRHERVLTEEESRQVLHGVDAFGLWNRQDTSYPNTTIVFDGVLWIVEGRRGTAYHSVFLAVEDDAVRSLFRFLLKSSGMARTEMDP